MANSKKPLLQALLGEKPDRYPIWFLRQAGRYLPEYQEIRSKMSFVELCQDPKKASEVTLQPLKRFDLDASIIFSDILIPPTAMGMTLTFDKGHGPVLSPTVRSKSDLDALSHDDIAKKLKYVGEAIELTKAGLKPEQTMIGFAGAPFTVASYMVEGSGSKNYTEIKKLAFGQPEVFSHLLAQIADATYEYLLMQVEYGAEAIMLFDSWAGHLCDTDYRNWVFPSISSLIERLKQHDIPIIYFPGQGSHLLSQLKGLKADTLAIDWRVGLGRAAAILDDLDCPANLQGNLDPQVFLGTKEFVQKRVVSILEAASSIKNRQHIFNVGHGLLPHTNIENLQIAIEAIRSWDR